MDTDLSVKSSTATIQQSNIFFNMFSCCKPSPTNKNSQASKPFLMYHPTSTLSMNNSPKKIISSKNPDSSLAAKFTFGIPYSNSRGQSIFEKEDLPIDMVFILGEKNKIVAKITHKKVEIGNEAQFLRVSTFNESVLSANAQRESIDSLKSIQKEKKVSFKDSVINSLKRNLLSRKDKTVNAEENSGLIPENIANHIANRLECDIIIDALCGCGGTAMQFARHCNYVVAIDHRLKRLNYAKKNAEANDVRNRIDFLNADFLKIKRLSGDIVFLDPSDTRKDKKEPYSVFKHAEPDLPNLLSKSLETSYCIALKLPHDTDVAELPILFHTTLEKYELYSKRFCIEIEMISNEKNQPDCIMVYFGDCSSIEIKEEYEAIYDHIFIDEKQSVKNRLPLNVVVAIIEKIGIRKTFKYFSDIQEENAKEESSPLSSSSRFDSFLQRIISKNVLTKEAVNKIIEEGGSNIFRAPSNSYVMDNSYISSLTLLKRNSGSPFLNSKAAHADDEESKLKRDSKRATRMPRSALEGVLETPSPRKKDKKNYNDMYFEVDGGRGILHSDVSRSLIEAGDEGRYLSKNSHDVSELIVSSYSQVNSSYLKDSSWGDECNSLRKSIKMKKEDTDETKETKKMEKMKKEKMRERINTTDMFSSNRKAHQALDNMSGDPSQFFNKREKRRLSFQNKMFEEKGEMFQMELNGNNRSEENQLF